MATPSDFSLEDSWDVTKPQEPLAIRRETLIDAIEYAITRRTYVELTSAGYHGQSDELKEWYRTLAILNRDEPVQIR